MAFYIELIKISEDKNFAYYRYEFYHPFREYISKSGKPRYESKIVSGKLKINKKNGEFSTIEIAEGDKGSHIMRAGLALVKHWEKGEYPEKTCWAS